MTESKALETLFPGPRRVILSTLFAEPDRWWSLAELASRAGVQPSTLRTHIVHMRDCGLVVQRESDGGAAFQPNVEASVFPEIHSIVKKLTRRHQGGETIMIVEDQPATAQITRILLESWGYRVVEAHSGEEALSVFDQNSHDVRLVLTDVLMPGMTGPQLADELVRRKPDLSVVFMSGYPSDELAHRSGAAFLPKPFNPASLSKMVRRELDRNGK